MQDKATQYEQQLQYVRSVVSGERPQKAVAFTDRNEQVALLQTFPCLDETFGGRAHDIGTRHSCPTCAVYMTELIADKLWLPDSKP